MDRERRLEAQSLGSAEQNTSYKQGGPEQDQGEILGGYLCPVNAISTPSAPATGATQPDHGSCAISARPAIESKPRRPIPSFRRLLRGTRCLGAIMRERQIIFFLLEESAMKYLLRKTIRR